jgi:hypothetical protein
VTLLGLTHSTTEQGRRFVPVTVNVSAGLPAAAEVCESELIAGVARGVVGLERVKGKEAEGATEFDTITPAVPGNATRAAGMEAVSCVALMKVVVCAAPFQSTSASLVKFVPVNVSVKPCALQYGVEAANVVDADSEVIAGGVPCAGPIVKGTTFDTSVVVVLLTFCVAD